MWVYVVDLSLYLLLKAAYLFELCFDYVDFSFAVANGHDYSCQSLSPFHIRLKSVSCLQRFNDLYKIFFDVEFIHHMPQLFVPDFSKREACLASCPMYKSLLLLSAPILPNPDHLSCFTLPPLYNVRRTPPTNRCSCSSLYVCSCNIMCHDI